MSTVTHPALLIMAQWLASTINITGAKVQFLPDYTKYLFIKKKQPCGFEQKKLISLSFTSIFFIFALYFLKIHYQNERITDYYPREL